MKIISELTDMAVLREIGSRLERRRIDAGFLGKLFVFLGLADHGYWGALVCAIIAASM